MKIIIPALPSDYARPYPELVLEGTAEQMRAIANALSGLDRSSARAICVRVSSKPSGDLLPKAIMSALGEHTYITGYLDYLLYCSYLSFDERYVIRAAIRAKWIDHIERSLWEQLGECQT